MNVEERRQHRHVLVRLELQHVCRVALQRLAARVHHDELRALLHRVLEESRGDRVVLGRVGADHDDHLGVLGRDEGRRHRGRADPLHQRRHRRGMAEPRAVIDVVGAEADPHQFLEQIGLLVRALGRAEAGERLARGVADALRPAAARSSASSQVAVRKWVQGLAGSISSSCFGTPSLRIGDGQALRMVDIVESEAALDAQPVEVGRPLPAVDLKELVVLDVVGDLAADAAIGADAVDLAVGGVGIDAGRRPAPPASARRWGRPARIRRRQHRCCCPSGRRSRTRFSCAPRPPCRSRRSPAPRGRRARTGCIRCRRRDEPPSPDGCGRAPACAWRGKRLSLTSAGRPSARSANPGRAPSRAPAGRRQAVEHQLARNGRARSRSAPSCPARVCGCRRPRARARPRSRPCRRGNCRRRDSRASAQAQMRDLQALAVRHLPDRLVRRGLDLDAVERKADRVGHSPAKKAWPRCCVRSLAASGLGNAELADCVPHCPSPSI